jgi:hypothetical protein
MRGQGPQLPPQLNSQTLPETIARRAAQTGGQKGNVPQLRLICYDFDQVVRPHERQNRGSVAQDAPEHATIVTP